MIGWVIPSIGSTPLDDTAGVQGNTVACMGSFQGLKQARKVPSLFSSLLLSSLELSDTNVYAP